MGTKIKYVVNSSNSKKIININDTLDDGITQLFTNNTFKNFCLSDYKNIMKSDKLQFISFDSRDTSMCYNKHVCYDIKNIPIELLFLQSLHGIFCCFMHDNISNSKIKITNLLFELDYRKDKCLVSNISNIDGDISQIEKLIITVKTIEEFDKLRNLVDNLPCSLKSLKILIDRPEMFFKNVFKNVNKICVKNLPPTLDNFSITIQNNGLLFCRNLFVIEKLPFGCIFKHWAFLLTSDNFGYYLL
jgi:hypothetical protein